VKDEAAAAAMRAVQWLAGGIGAVSAISGIAGSSAVIALNTIGILGSGSLIGAGLRWREGGSLPEKVKASSSQAGFGFAVCAFLYFGSKAAGNRSFDFIGPTFGFFTILGIVWIVGAVVLASLIWEYQVREPPPERKTCPDCANEVLVAARKCQYCGYRFDGR
jgi:hypothetical protein